LHTVLNREHLALRLKRQRSSVEEAIALYSALTVSGTPAAVPPVVAADRDDDQVIAAAVAARADLIVSGDRDLLALGSHQTIGIVTPADAIARMGR
jgi:predicted nucleic acid-binding protein